MERVLYNLHEKSCSQLLLRTSSRSRGVLESFSLAIAVISFCTVLLFHRSYVFYGHGSIPVSCLEGIANIRPLQSVDVTRVAISTLHTQSISIYHPHSQQQSVPRTMPSCEDENQDSWISPYNNTVDNDTAAKSGNISSTTSPICLAHNLSQLDKNLSLSFSPYEGYLSLPISILHRINVTMQYIIISKRDTNCFGDDRLLKYALDYILTPKAAEEVIALNWILGFQNTLKGYVKRHKANHIIDLSTYSREFRTVLLHLPFLRRASSPATTSSSRNTMESYMKNDLFFKIGVLLSSLFLFFLTTTIVSFTLRTTQSRMLHFTIQLQKHIRQRKHFSQLIIIHCVETMVFVPIILGIFFFLNDCFYNDKVLSFTILSGIWVCEIYSAVFLRTIPSSIYFPQVFFAYFTLFHVYYFSCPFGFTYAALFSITLLMLHSMLFFVNRFELPAFAAGLVSRTVPRMAVFRNPSQSPETNQVATHPFRGDDRGNVDINNTNGGIRRTNSTHRMANGMSYPSMSSLGRITTSDGFDDSDDL